MKITNIMDGITSLVANLGTQRDKAATVEYVENVYEEHEIRAIYRTSWLANKIVDIPAFDSFRRWRSWQASKDQVELLEEEEKRLDLKAKMLKVETLARLYGGAALYFDLGDDPSKKAPSVVKKGAIRFCTVLTHKHLSPGEIDLDPLSPDFGMPLWYSVVGATRGELRIHPSRLVLRYGGTRLDAGLYGLSAGIWGDSVLYPLFDTIKQFDGTTANLASLVFEAKIDVISTKGLMSMVGDPIQEAKLLERYRLAAQTKGNNGMLLLDGDTEEYSQKSASFASLPDLMDRFAQNAAGGADIPMTRLFGKSPGGLSSTGESDLRNYYDRIAASQSLHITPAMETMDELLIQSAIGSRPPEVHFIWSSLWQLGETERAEIGNKNANTIKTMADTGLIADEALAESLVGMMVEASVMPGLEAAYKKYGAPPEEDLLPEEGGPGELPTEPKVDPKKKKNTIKDAAPATLYVYRPVLNGADIVRWAKSQGFKTTLAADDLHVTIAYSKVPVDWMSVGESYEEKIELGAGGPRRMDKFGEASVLLISSNSLRWRHESFLEAGATWEHDGYQPHITISYDEAPEVVVPYTGRVVLGPEVFEEIKEDWSTEVKKNLGDEQARHPAGSPQGGQFASMGGSGGATSADKLKQKALESVASDAYPVEKILTFLDKPNSEMTQGEYKKALAYKKALQAEKEKLAGTYVEKVKVPKAPKVVPIDPSSAEGIVGLSKIANELGHNMNLETATNLATGEWQPDPNKSWQAKVAAEGKKFLANEPVPAAPQGEAKPSYSVKQALDTTPPPATDAYTPQTKHAAHGSITVAESVALQAYTGSGYTTINKALRNNEVPHKSTKDIDTAIANSKAITDMVVLRGISSEGMQSWLAGSGKTSLVAGAVITDKGFASTTRLSQVASNFAGHGYGLKIVVPKGHPILPLKSLSQHAKEDEFLLPRGTAYKVTGVSGSVITVTVAKQ